MLVYIYHIGIRVMFLASNNSWLEKLSYEINERLINLIIGLLGAVLILGGILFSELIGAEWETVIVSVGASLVASSVVSYLSSIYIYKRKRAKDITETWGLMSLSQNRSKMNVSIEEKLDKATDHLDIIAYGLKSLRETKTRVLLDKIAHGLRIRIITVDPDCKFLGQRDTDENKLAGSTRESIIQLCKWAADAQTHGNQTLQIKFCNTLPTEVYFRVDDYIYTGPYQFGRESQHTITMEFRGHGEGYKYYSEYFDALWNDKHFCIEKPELLQK